LTPNTYKPDWLLSTPGRDSYLIKQEYMYKPNYVDKVANRLYLMAYGQENEDLVKTMRTYDKLLLDSKNSNNLKQLT
jgi:hypothetical protein